MGRGRSPFASLQKPKRGAGPRRPYRRRPPEALARHGQVNARLTPLQALLYHAPAPRETPKKNDRKKKAPCAQGMSRGGWRHVAQGGTRCAHARARRRGADAPGGAPARESANALPRATAPLRGWAPKQSESLRARRCCVLGAGALVLECGRCACDVAHDSLRECKAIFTLPGRSGGLTPFPQPWYYGDSR